MSMLTQLLNQSYLESVREKEGASYGVSVYGKISKYPEPKEEAFMQIYFDTDPDKRTAMTDIVLKELDHFVQNGAPEENLVKAKEFLHKKHKENLRLNNYWVNQLFEYYWYDTDMDMDAAYDNMVDAITMKDVQDFADTLFKQGNRIEVCMISGNLD